MTERIDDNVSHLYEGDKHKVVCNHCSQVLAENSHEYMDNLARYDGPVTMAGPQVSPDSEIYIDAEVTFRQFCCPGCYTAFFTMVVPKEEQRRVV